MAGKHRVIRHHPITPKRLACGGLAGAAILGSLAVPVAAFANPTDDDEPHIVKQLGADWIPMGEKDTETTYATHPDGWTPPEPQATGDDQAKFDAAKAAGFPGFEPDKGGSKGIEEVTQPDPSAPVSGHNWDGVAQYESSGDWAANTGNGYYGGLQIWPPTWIDFGGWEFAALPHEATKEQQIIVAERILAVQGKEAWPNCGQYLQDAAPNPPADLTAPCSDHNVSFSEANMQPGSIKLARAICAVFGDRLDIIGGWRPYDAISQDHPSGHAIDIMIPDYSTPEGSQLGSDVAGWVMDHAAEYDVQYLIHKQTYWDPQGNTNVMEDRGGDTANHYDHVHVTVN